MVKKKIQILVAVAGILFCSFFGFNSVFADFDGMDSVMTISPPRQRIVLTPGEDYEGSILVSSSSTSIYDLAYSVTVGAFNLVKDEDGNVDYNDVDVDTVTSYNQIMDWIELKEDSGIIPRGESRPVSFVIHVPKDAPAGGQYATIIVQDDTESDSNEDGSNKIQIETKVRFAANIFAEVTGKTREEGEILDNSIPSFLLSNKLEASSTVKNKGNVHTDATYVLQVWPLFSDEEVCTNEEEPSTSMIMPETERYHSESCNLPSFGIFKAKQMVKIFGEESIVEKTIIVCPIWLLFLIIFLIVLAIGWVVFRIRSRGGKSSRRDD